MCGIAGILSREAPGERLSLAGEMIASLGHRGPNGSRIETTPAGILAHARLSIIDLDGGWQPLHAAGSTIIGNGEIYNYLELTESFKLEGELGTGSDFEPLLHLYAREGEKAFERLRGMYAFCLVGVDGRSWLVRDPYGIKPLYGVLRGEELLFASEPNALWRAIGSAPRLYRERSEDLLALNYVLDDGPDSCGVFRLPPGAVWQVTHGAVPRKTSIPALPETTPSVHRADEEAVRQLDLVLEDSVRVHQRSDVPYGLFLSGGVDSTAIAVMMARLNERPVCAFTCGFDVQGPADERRAAERVARALDLDWREITFTEADFWRIAPLVAKAMDDPTSDYASLATFKLAEAAKAEMTVILSGEGGDELFAGYGRYRRALRPAWLGGRPAEPQVDPWFVASAPGRGDDRAWEAGAAARTPLERWRAASLPASVHGSPLLRAQRADISTWLPRDLLLKLDRCLMAHGLEGRTPFLDREVAAFALSLPDRQKIRGGRGKWVLRKWLEAACPAADPWGAKKGFTVPVAAWINPRARELGERIVQLQALEGVLKAEAVRSAFTDEAHAQKRWPILFFALWRSIHSEGFSPEEASERLFLT